MNARYKPIALVVGGFLALPFLANFGGDTWMLAVDIVLAGVLGYCAKRRWSQLLGLLLLAVAINICRAAFFDWLYSVPQIPYWRLSDLFEETVPVLPCDLFACLAGLFFGQSLKESIRGVVPKSA